MKENNDYLVSCDTCKKGYLRKESMKEPCLYCVGNSHFENLPDVKQCKLYRCRYIILYGFEDGIKQTQEDYIDIEAQVIPTIDDVKKTLEGNNLLPKLLLEVWIFSIKEINKEIKNEKREIF
jgi:hypothetical protein